MPPDSEDHHVAAAVAAVAGARRYRGVDRALIERLVRQERPRGDGSVKDTIARTRRRLHQIFGSFLPHAVKYGKLHAQLTRAAADGPEALREALRRAMKTHTSTAERLPILEPFYQALSERVGRPRTIVDVGCGMGPLAYPWFSAAHGARYMALDIDADLVGFVGHCLALLGVDSDAGLCDAVATAPPRGCDLALLFKLVPSLERQAEGRGLELIAELGAAQVAVSFPTRSLCSREKGMRENYGAWFEQQLEARGWSAERIDFSTELLYLVRV